MFTENLESGTNFDRSVDDELSSSHRHSEHKNYFSALHDLALDGRAAAVVAYSVVPLVMFMQLKELGFCRLGELSTKKVFAKVWRPSYF